MKKIISALAIFLLFPLTAHADSHIDVWGGFGRKDNVYSCIATEEKIVALTFDDGPHPRYTDEILDILAKYGARATFFVIGKNAESYPEKLKRIAAEGHEIGNHTYSHVTAGKVSEGDFRRELEKAHDIIKKLTGVSPVLFRPPTGYCDAATVRSAARLSYKIIVWNVDTKDWMHTCAENIISNVSISARGGCIVLFHDYVSAPSPTPKALSVLIPSLMRSGYRFVTVSELISLDARKS